MTPSPGCTSALACPRRTRIASSSTYPSAAVTALSCAAISCANVCPARCVAYPRLVPTVNEKSFVYLFLV